jgi:hypothetical protein
LVEELEARLENSPVAWIRCRFQVVEHSYSGMLQTLSFVLDVELLKGYASGCHGGTPVRG